MSTTYNAWGGLKKKVLILSCSILFFSCKSQQYLWGQLPEPRLVFGSGGGFSGAVDTYILLENGQLFHENSLSGAVEPLPSITKREALSLFEAYEALGLAGADVNHPGNMYYFMGSIHKGEKHTLTWGKRDRSIPKAYADYYEQLQQTIKPRK